MEAIKSSMWASSCGERDMVIVDFVVAILDFFRFVSFVVYENGM